LPHTRPERLRQELHSDPYVGTPKYRVLYSLVQTGDFAGVITQLKTSGLRGMGGAGFPCGNKWEAVRNCVDDEKYVVCNADESEPGTIKDRFIMQNLPHLLIEAIEGKRSEPRNKPPFPVYQGLWHKPTALNNVETFALATVILARGVEWFKNYGRKGSPGIKFVGISGEVRNPGVFEVPMGIT